VICGQTHYTKEHTFCSQHVLKSEILFYNGICGVSKICSNIEGFRPPNVSLLHYQKNKIEKWRDVWSFVKVNFHSIIIIMWYIILYLFTGSTSHQRQGQDNRCWRVDQRCGKKNKACTVSKPICRGQLLWRCLISHFSRFQL